MRLSWNEVRLRAAAFAQTWKGKGYERGDTQTFYNHFFQIFGIPVNKVATFEEPVKKLGNRQGFIDLFWKGVLLVEQKGIGKELTKAKEQAFEYIDGLKDFEVPRYILLSNFQSFELIDLVDKTEYSFLLEDLSENVEKFGFILGVQKRTFQEQDPVNIKASEIVGELHNSLKSASFTGHDLKQFLVRIVFCLFADDTGIFETRDMFQDFIENRTNEDGSDVGPKIAQLFQILNTPIDKRGNNLDSDLAAFCFVNGDLFKERLLIPDFDSSMRQLLLRACHFDWSRISPAIFGSLFQFVMDSDERREQGAHYTTEKNIMKVIAPLFLNDLRSEFEQIKARKDTHRRKELLKFQDRLSKLTFFDPACGCGNFLVVAYREVRLLELELIREIQNMEKNRDQLALDATRLSLINVDQFYGIEISEFPVRIAETALWMMDHILNNRLSLEFGQSYVRIPLNQSPQIFCADAITMDWNEALPSQKCTYILGNPPFRGSKFQSQEQRLQVRKLADLGKTGGTLDYAAAWFIKAGSYLNGGQTKVGFVATSSITQGEQVAQLWPILLHKLNLEIAFAHRSFEWESEASGKAHVYVVILGLASREFAPKQRLLFSYDESRGDPHETSLKEISPYLFDAGNLPTPKIVVRETSKPINGLPQLISGSQPIDGGHYIFDNEQKSEFLKVEPKARKFIRPYVGSQEFLHGQERWILALHDATPKELAGLPYVEERIKLVKASRASSSRTSTKRLSDYPRQYCVNVIPQNPFLVLPEVSTDKREYIPIGWLEPPAIPSNKLRLLENATYTHFALLNSTMHMTWLRYIGGRLGKGYSYGIGVVYNTFPIPPIPSSAETRFEQLAKDILAIRNKFKDSSLSEIYNPIDMPPELRRAHQKLDTAVDTLYGKKKFVSEHERCVHLLTLYENLLAAAS